MVRAYGLGVTDWETIPGVFASVATNEHLTLGYSPTSQGSRRIASVAGHRLAFEIRRDHSGFVVVVLELVDVSVKGGVR